MASSTEQKELALVSKVELRIALSDSDAKLEAILNTYLPPLLLKLASEHAAVISILQHVNTRIKPPTIKLPLSALLKQFKAPSSTSLIRYFDLLYIQQGLGRVSGEDRVELLPTLIHGLSSDCAVSMVHGAGIFNLFLRVLPYLSLPSRGSGEDGQFREKLGLDQRPEDAAFVARYLGKVLLLALVRPVGTEVGRPKSSCPALSLEDYCFLTLDGKSEAWDSMQDVGLNLTETKIHACKFLASGAFTDQERYFPALFAAADTNSVIGELGDGMMKRSGTGTSLEDDRVVRRLFEIYFGDSASQTPPARIPLRTKILTLLAKSILATNYTDYIVRLVRDGVISTGNREEGSAGSSSASGREASKLRGAIFSFTNWVARMGDPSNLHAVAPQLVHTLRDYIESQGWPRMDELHDTSAESTLRSYAYEIIGLLAKVSPNILLLDPNIDLVRWLFTSLSTDASGDNISVSIGEALGGVLQAMSRTLDEDVAGSLRSLLVQHMNLDVGQESPAGDPYKVQRSTRFIAVRFATRCLPYSDVVGRWICLLAIGGKANERNEVMEEGRRGLDPYWYRMLNPPKDGPLFATHEDNDPKYQFPDYRELIRYFFIRPVAVEHESMDIDATSIVERYVDRLGVYGAAINFCRRMLWAQAIRTSSKAMEIDVTWEQRLDTAVATDDAVRQVLRKYLSNLASERSESDRTTFSVLLQASFDGLCWSGGQEIESCGDCLVELCTLADDRLIEPLAAQVKYLQGPVFTNKVRARTIAGQAFGIIASHSACPLSVTQPLCEILFEKAKAWRVVVGLEVNQTHGSIIALARLFSRLSLRQRKTEASALQLDELTPLLLDILSESKDNLLQEAAILALDQLSIFSVLSPAGIPSPHTATTFTAHLVGKAKTGNEKVILAIGHFAMTCNEDESLLENLLDSLYQLHELRQAEVQFSVGDALSCAASGWQSLSLATQVDVDAGRPEAAPRTKTLSDMLDKVLKDCRQTKPAMRKAAAIWLLCLIQNGGHLPEVQDRLRRCQVAFKSFLSDRDELVQESASRGLTLIYEKGDKNLKDDLVRDLVSSFTGTSTNLAGNVDVETELFEPGALPTGDGSVATYKDIMSLATEVGDPSLVYRFMSMASSNAIWSSRAAFGRFGLGNILSESSVDGYLAENSKLYPKLYRYRFDPNAKVRKSMNDIWTALVKDPSAIIDRYFDEIMEDLLVSILGKEWRVREASCGAIADLVQGRPLEKYEAYLGPIWSVSFKVLDDIKESVRAAAMNLCRVLTGLLVRSVEAGSSSHKSRVMLENVMPFLMSPAGLEASAEEVQMFALDTILRLAKTGNRSLLPFVPSLIERLLGLLSTLEPEAVNYLHLNASKYNLTTDKIDAARLKSVRSSPMMDAIEKCLDILDEDSMKTLTTHLESAIKHAVGMPSKVGCSRVLVSLSTRHSVMFRPYAGTFLKAIQKTVLDRNDAVSASYAAAAGYLSRLASDKDILQLEQFAQKLYFDVEDERHRVTSGELIYAISKHATDRFAALGSAFLPFVFIAKHDTQDAVKESYLQTWNENVGGTRTVLLYLQEIIGLATIHLDSTRWAVKHAAALGIADAATAGHHDMSARQQEIVWPALDRALTGKSWDGKERVLEAYVTFALGSTLLQQGRPEITQRMQKQIVVESNRKNACYRQSALISLGKFADEIEGVDLSREVLDTISVVIDEVLGEPDEMDVDRSEAKSTTAVKLSRQVTIANATRSGFQAIKPCTLLEPADLVQRITWIVGLIERVKASADSGSSGEIQIAMIDGTAMLAKRLRTATEIALGSFFSTSGLMTSLLSFISPLTAGSTNERIKRAEAADELAQLFLQYSKSSRSQHRQESEKESMIEWRTAMEKELSTARAAERDRTIQSTIERITNRGLS